MMAKATKFNLGPIEDASKKAIRDLAFLYARKCAEVISEPGVFSSPEDIVDWGSLRAGQQVSRGSNKTVEPTQVSDTNYQLSWGMDYSYYVWAGYTRRDGTEVEGRPWTVEAERRMGDIPDTFEKLLGLYL